MLRAVPGISPRRFRARDKLASDGVSNQSVAERVLERLQQARSNRYCNGPRREQKYKSVAQATPDPRGGPLGQDFSCSSRIVSATISSTARVPVNINRTRACGSST
jgi:hypothetical protein